MNIYKYYINIMKILGLNRAITHLQLKYATRKKITPTQNIFREGQTTQTIERDEVNTHDQKH